MDITVTLTDQEYSDLQAIAEEQLKTPEDCARDLLVDAIAAQMARSPGARSRSFQRGVTAARGQTSFTDAAVRTMKTINASSYPAPIRRNL